MPKEQPPFGVIGAVWLFSHLYAVVSVLVSSTSKLGRLSLPGQLEDVCFKIFAKRRWGRKREERGERLHLYVYIYIYI
jgi:hypothetical protein